MSEREVHGAVSGREAATSTEGREEVMRSDSVEQSAEIGSASTGAAHLKNAESAGALPALSEPLKQEVVTLLRKFAAPQTVGERANLKIDAREMAAALERSQPALSEQPAPTPQEQKP